MRVCCEISKKRKKAIEDPWKELIACVKTIKSSDVIVNRYFNEDTHSKSMEEFSIEAGSCGLLAEIHSAEKYQRGATFEHGSKCIGVMLATEGVLR